MIQDKSYDNTANYGIIFVLTLVHFTGDLYSSFFTPLLPAFVDKLGLTLTQVGLITGMVRFLSFIVQPVVGYLADRYETRSFVFAGLFLAFFFIPFSGIAPNFWTLLIILCIGSIGSSMFHPSTTGMVPLYSGNSAGFCLSIYNTGGTFAFALGPVFITWYVAGFGLEQMPYTILFGAIAFIFCLKYLPVPVSENLSHLGFFGSLKETLGKVYKSIFLIWLVMVLRAVTGQTFMTFMPIYLTDKGHSLVSVGLIVSLFILASLPLGVVMAQKLAPKSRAMVSSIMMGFAYGLGGLVSPLVGKLADIYGLENVLFYSAFIPIVTLLPIMKFPKVK